MDSMGVIVHSLNQFSFRPNEILYHNVLNPWLRNLHVKKSEFTR